MQGSSKQPSVTQPPKDGRLESKKASLVVVDAKADISGITEPSASAADKKLVEATKRMNASPDVKTANDARVSFEKYLVKDGSNTQKNNILGLIGQEINQDRALYVPPAAESQSMGSQQQHVDKEKEEELFEEAMGHLIGNFSIVLNFNS